MSKHLHKVISSSIRIDSTVANVWDKITTVEIEHFRFPWYFRLMNIPKPIRAEITREGVGGNRVAYFDNGKRFMQEIDTWELHRTYSFTFNPENGFKAGFVFDLFSGIFRIQKGTYFISNEGSATTIELRTDYSIQRNVSWLMSGPIHLVLVVFQNYLLTTIKANAEVPSSKEIK